MCLLCDDLGPASESVVPKVACGMQNYCAKQRHGDGLVPFLIHHHILMWSSNQNESSHTGLPFVASFLCSTELPCFYLTTNFEHHYLIFHLTLSHSALYHPCCKQSDSFPNLSTTIHAQLQPPLSERRLRVCTLTHALQPQMTVFVSTAPLPEVTLQAAFDTAKTHPRQAHKALQTLT